MRHIDVKVKNKMTAAEQSGYNDRPFVIISISTPGDNKNEFKRNDSLRDVLYISFDDIEDAREGGTMMSRENARDIVNFIVRWHVLGIPEIWVHCDAGISRSAGVAAAIMKFFNNDDTPIFDNPKYCPNMHCYRYILDAFQKFVDGTLNR